MLDPLHPRADGFPGGFPSSAWIEKAESSLAAAEALARHADDRFHDAIALHCFLAAQRLLKAALVSSGVAPPDAADLVELLTALKSARPDWSWPPAELTKLTVGARYAGSPGYVISPDDATDILRITRAVWNSLRPLI